MMKLRYISYLFLCFPLTSYSQEVTAERKNDLDEEKNKISLVAGVSYINNSFGLRFEKQIFRLKPNDSFYTELFLRYRWLDTSISFTPKLIKINNDDDVKGKTKYFNVNFAFFLTSKFRQMLGYNQIRGLYFQDTKKYMSFLLQGIDENISDGYIQFPDANYRSFKGETSYLWIGNKENYRSYTNMTYKPLKNDFVVISGLFYQYNILSDSDRAIYLGEVLDGGGGSSTTKDVRFALRTGVGIQRIVKTNWYAVVEFYPQLNYSKLIDEDFHEFNFGINSNVRLGYDNGKWFVGAGTQLNWVNSSNVNFYSTTQWQFRAGIGLRFNSPKFVNRNFDKIENILK